MTTIRVLTAFANAHAADARKASGFELTCSYVYDSDHSEGLDIKPHRAFADSNGTVYIEGRGFPDDTVTPELWKLQGGPDVCCINGEFHKPLPWGEVREQMRWLGLLKYGQAPLAQAVLARYQVRCLIEARRYCPTVGMFGRAPFEGIPDLERGILMYATAWMPSLYVWNPDGDCDSRTIDGTGMPKSETIPLVYGLYTYGGGLVSVQHWADTLTKAIGLGATRLILWHDCTAPESVEQVRVTGDRMREAAKAIGVELA